MYKPQDECPCPSPDLQLWDKKTMQVEIEDGHYEKEPIATNENATTHEFRVLVMEKDIQISVKVTFG
jgi:hypothetical protein